MSIPLSGPISLAGSACAVLSQTGLSCEPYGETPFLELVNHHAEQALACAGAPWLVFDGLTSICEMRAAIIGSWHAARPVVPVVVASGDEEGRLPSTASLLCALIIAQNLRAAGFALECPDGALRAELLKRLSPYAKIPLWEKRGGALHPCGNSTVLPGDLRDVIVVCNETDVFYLEEDFELSRPVLCELDMADSLFAAEEEGCDVISIALSSVDDAYRFSLNAPMAKLPVSFLADREEILEAALLYFSGRAILDARGEVGPEQLARLAAGYGAIVR